MMRHTTTGAVALVAVWMLSFPGTGDAQLQLVKRCGQLQCDAHQFCSDIDQQCRSCDSICDRAHNFNERLCVAQCQDYLHDLIYARKDGEKPGSSYSLNVREEIESLKTQQAITLSLLILIIIGIAIYWIVLAIKWCKSNDITITKLRNKFFHKKTEVTAQDAKTISNPNARMEGNVKAPPIELRLDMPPTSPSHSTDIQTPGTISTSLSRRPAEDSTLDYAAYDNHAMRTPSAGNSPAHRTN